MVQRGGALRVATAARPEGPFAEITGDAPKAHLNKGDLGLFVDNDGAAYLTYVSTGYRIVVEPLTPDYLRSAGPATGPPPDKAEVEAPALFRRGKFYYLLFDNTCGWGGVCNSGTGARVYISRHPIGPWTYKGNINRVGSRSRDLPSPWTTPGTGRTDTIIKAQQTCVAVLPGSHEDQYLWMGDRWGSAPDDIKGHDFQNWALLSFAPDGMIQQLKNEDTFSLEVAAK